MPINPAEVTQRGTKVNGSHRKSDDSLVQIATASTRRAGCGVLASTAACTKLSSDVRCDPLTLIALCVTSSGIDWYLIISISLNFWVAVVSSGVLPRSTYMLNVRINHHQSNRLKKKKKKNPKWRPNSSFRWMTN